MVPFCNDSPPYFNLFATNFGNPSWPNDRMPLVPLSWRSFWELRHSGVQSTVFTYKRVCDPWHGNAFVAFTAFTASSQFFLSKAQKETERETCDRPVWEQLLFVCGGSRQELDRSENMKDCPHAIHSNGMRNSFESNVLLREYWSAQCQHCSLTSHCICRWSRLQLLLAHCAICELNSAITGAAIGECLWSGLTALSGKAATYHQHLAG